MSNRPETNKQSCPVYKNAAVVNCKICHIPNSLNSSRGKSKNFSNAFAPLKKLSEWKLPTTTATRFRRLLYGQKGKIISGVYQSGSHHVVGIDSCQTEDVIADKSSLQYASSSPLSEWQPITRTQAKVFSVTFLWKEALRQIRLCLCLWQVHLFSVKNNFVKAILKQFPEITTIVQNINPYRTNLVLGDNQKVLYGKGYIEDILCGCRFRISPKSFYQINPVQTEVLYGKAIEFANLKGNETVLDTYCGIGTIGIIAAKTAQAMLSVQNLTAMPWGMQS